MNPPRRPRTARVATMVVFGLLTLAGVVGVVDATLDPSPTAPHPLSATLTVLLLLVFMGCGALLVSQRPDLTISWLLPLPGIYLVLDAGLDLAELVAPASAVVWLDWFGQVSWAWTFPTLAIFLPLLFPNGAPPTPRWRWAVVVGTAAVVVVTIGNAIDPRLMDDPPNPAALDQGLAQVLQIVGGLLLVVALVASACAAVVRARRSAGVERQQLRWFARGAAVVPIAWVIAILLEGTEQQELGGAILAGSLVALPIAVTIAVLRYRLYDIDRLVSRTVSYALLTGVLVGVYALGVLGIGSLLPGEPSDLLVAGSTLAVAALFRPLRSRIQAGVDRRFNRSRYDAARTVERFGARLRDEVDLASLQAGLVEVVRATVQPGRLAVWTRVPEPGP